MSFDAFLNLGPHIRGEAQDKVHGPSGDIEVFGWTWGLHIAAPIHHGIKSGFGKARFHEVSFTKFIDASSPALMTALAKGSRIPVARLVVRRTGQGSQKYLELTMTNVQVTSYLVGSSSEEERSVEYVNLAFSAVVYEYYRQASNGVVTSAGSFNWDIAGNSEE